MADTREKVGLPCYRIESYGIIDPELGETRLTSTDAHLLMPAKVPVRLVVTSADVIHNWNIKAMALSVDGIPGRLGAEIVITKVTGLFHGWCSENCGAGHFSMPCSLEIIPFVDFIRFFTEEPQLAVAEAVSPTVEVAPEIVISSPFIYFRLIAWLDRDPFRGSLF